MAIHRTRSGKCIVIDDTTRIAVPITYPALAHAVVAHAQVEAGLSAPDVPTAIKLLTQPLPVPSAKVKGKRVASG